MLKTVDLPVSKPCRCSFRHCAADSEIVKDYERFCYCGVLPEFLQAINKTRDQSIPEFNCSDNEFFPDWCPLSKNNINVWRDR